MLNPQTLEKIKYGTSDERKYLCEKSFELFICYYFTEYLTYPFAPFHYEMFEDLLSLQLGEINELMFIGFGESAKTSIAKIFLIYIICYEKRHYLNVDAFDKGNAESILFDVVLSLQSNQKLIDDFGQIYNAKRSVEEVQRKKVTDFITNTGIRVEAHSTQESVRGRLYQNYRPDFFYVEDFETTKTSVSDAYTAQVIRHLEELQRGLSPNAWVLYCANYISDRGSVENLVKRAETDKRFRVRNYPIIIDGKPSWPAKYALTDEEAQKTGKVSIEEKRRKLKERFNPEMMNDPSSAELAFFDRKRIDSMIAATTLPIETSGGARYYYRYNPAHRYAIGGDTSMGIGRDNNASAGFDFSTIPSRLVLAYENNEISPDLFAYELKAQGGKFGDCLIAPEVNSESGGTCVNQLRSIYPIDKIYRRIPKERIVDKLTARIGWETNAATKPEIMYQFRTSVNDGQVEILDLGLLQLMRSFVFNPDIHVPDLLMAAAIAWEMRNHARADTSTIPTYQQPAYERPGLDSDSQGPVETVQETQAEFSPHRR